ncbi:MAG: hypothetical protein LBC84_09840 [Prevotellaceae bacterium]|nr:hypothetical protein [Prevotellaceae bacterium]
MSVSRKLSSDLLHIPVQRPVEFYAPRYDTSEEHNATKPDLRTTIHWQPVVQTASQGVASFEFYTADESTSYTVRPLQKRHRPNFP